ncbi:hypothetical protein [Ruminococcus sp.]|uniref:hypothetical protein n=1 Tax=Ruminococcus sp. TaxID=41978 RepID=UPI0025D41668|nr:hypothetical protein [Ruminococcus sp.]MBQ8966036.1 hypothetical protein [Ruminococcus sp.]
MSNFNKDEMIAGLPEELKAKAKGKTPEELMKLAGEYDIELPNSALEAVAGGGCDSKVPACPSCKSEDTEKDAFTHNGLTYKYHCRKCDNYWN